MTPCQNPLNVRLSLLFTAPALLILASCLPRPIPPPVRDMEVVEHVDAPAPPVLRKATPVEVKIGLRTDVSKAEISCSGPIRVTHLSTNIEERWPAGSYIFEGRPGGLVVAGKSIQGSVRLSPALSGHYLQTSDKTYRGVFLVSPTGGSKVTVVNQLNVDDYLKGVLPREVIVTWPLEALKVQAVASRTYLASHLGRHSAHKYDLCSDVHCQVYGGMSREHPQTNRAVEETRGEILTYNGKAIRAFFHANCGGSTEMVEHVWGSSHRPYLTRRRCTYCTEFPHYNWTRSFSRAEVLRLLKSAKRVEGNELRSVRIKQRSPSNRVEFITVTTDAGTYDMKGNDFRIALHPERIRSTMWTAFNTTSDGYEFSGTGWGHGVGLCQWGARGQAERGRSYTAILQFYYPNTRLSVWSRR